jgi:hypothetical protein
VIAPARKAAVARPNVPRGWVIVFAAVAAWGLFAVLFSAALEFVRVLFG